MNIKKMEKNKNYNYQKIDARHLLFIKEDRKMNY